MITPGEMNNESRIPQQEGAHLKNKAERKTHIAAECGDAFVISDLERLRQENQQFQDRLHSETVYTHTPRLNTSNAEICITF